MLSAPHLDTPRTQVWWRGDKVQKASAAAPFGPEGLEEIGHLGAVGCAAALALATVFAFAAVVAGFAAALALAVVLALTGVLCGLVGIGIPQTGLGHLGRGSLRRCRARGSRMSRNGSAHQSGQSCGEEQSIELILHGD